MKILSLNLFNPKKLTLISMISLCSIYLSGCPYPIMYSPVESPATINLEKDTIKLTENINFSVVLKKSTLHKLEYRFAADKGKIETNNNEPNGKYIAPSVAGSDTIRVSIFDVTDNINLPAVSKSITVIN